MDDIRHFRFDPDAIFRQLETAAEKMTEAKEKADQLEEQKKGVLAMLTLRYMESCKSRVEAETRALADPEYHEDYIIGMVAAKRDYERKRAGYKNYLVLAELRRSQESTRRTLSA